MTLMEPIKRKPRLGGPLSELGYWLQSEPCDPDSILHIFTLRHTRAMTFEQIGEELGCSRVNACRLYHRWRDWALNHSAATPA
jgi:hypothetical protein